MRRLLLAGVLSTLCTSGLAGEREPTLRDLAFAGGWFDFTQQDDPAAEVRGELRGKGDQGWRPLAGVLLTSGGSFYVCAGIGYDLLLGRRVVVTPSLAPGLYLQGGGKDLGLPLEFRSQIEVAYRLRSGARLGLAFSHLSNANIGKTNPGAQSVVVYYEVPLRSRHASE